MGLLVRYKIKYYRHIILIVYCLVVAYEIVNDTIYPPKVAKEGRYLLILMRQASVKLLNCVQE